MPRVPLLDPRVLLAVLLAACGGQAPDDDGTATTQPASTTAGSDSGGAASSGVASSDATTAPGSSAGSDGADSSGGSGTTGEDPPDGLAMFDTTRVHAIEITVAEADLATLDNDLETRVPCTLRYDDTVVMQAGIKKKGQSTLQPLDGKPSFNLKLDEFVEGADIDGIARLALDNTIMDTTFLSEPLTYLLYARAGVAAPRTAHAIVRFNGEVKGIYVVVEGVGKRFLGAHFGDGEGNLFEGPWDFDHDIAAVELKDEDEGRTRDDLQALAEVVLASPDDGLEAALEPLLDVDEFIDTVALDMAFCLWDGYAIAAWNYYLYHVPGDRFVLLPHGADWPYWVYDVDPFDVDFRPWGDQYPSGLLANRVVTVPGLRARYEQALVEIRDVAFDTDVLIARVDEVESILHATDEPAIADELAAFDGSVQTARDFVLQRRAFLDGI
ncbi:MAG: CotH kinase family protein [Nannocystaceae bacterium]|nr:CotH kinase family protein [Nannocystaceae bacterium]